MHERGKKNVPDKLFCPPPSFFEDLDMSMSKLLPLDDDQIIRTYTYFFYPPQAETMQYLQCGINIVQKWRAFKDLCIVFITSYGVPIQQFDVFE